MPEPKQRFRRRARLAGLLLLDFRLPLAILIVAVTTGGYVIHLAFPELPIADCFFAAFAALFFEIIVSPPFPWYAELFLFTAPLAGLFVIADGIAILVSMLFGRDQKTQRWWTMTASSYRNHVIVGGVGKVGFRITRELQEMGELVVGIDTKERSTLIQELLDDSIPVLQGSVRSRASLERANLKQARALICCTNDDLANLDAAFTARELNPEIRVVVRFFDDTLAPKISKQFELPALSTSYAAAPAFVSAALGLESEQTNLTIYGHQARVNAMRVHPDLDGKTVAEIESAKGVRILGLGKGEGGEEQTVFPAPDAVLHGGDEILVAAIHGGEGSDVRA